MERIILVEDDEKTLSSLLGSVRELVGEEASVESWQAPEGGGAISDLSKTAGEGVVLVVSDVDLSRSRGGIFGDTVARWCQEQAIPAALYSRVFAAEAPRIPDLFELRIGTDGQAATIAALFRGFRDTLQGVSHLLEGDEIRGPSMVLATLLDQPSLEFEFAPYLQNLGETSGALFARVARTGPSDAVPERPAKTEVTRVLAYVLGHVLVNSVLRYPGPILSMGALCAYVGASTSERDALADLFDPQRYLGPFHELDRYFWRPQVDERLESSLPAGDVDENTIRRRAVEGILGRDLAVHDCERCGGENGGFYCPFTDRPVCDRSDCATASNSWLPAGASVCRIERDFFDEWAPLLGY